MSVLNKFLAYLFAFVTMAMPSVSSVTTVDGLVVPAVRRLTVTGYSSRIRETDSTPFITATGDSVVWGGIAFSQDLLSEYGYGAIVWIEGMGLFYVNDVMNERIEERVDIWFPETGDAIRFGVRNLRVHIYVGFPVPNSG